MSNEVKKMYVIRMTRREVALTVELLTELQNEHLNTGDYSMAVVISELIQKILTQASKGGLK